MTLNHLIKFAIYGVAMATIAVSAACGKKKGGSAAAAAPQCLSGECVAGQQYSSGFFLARGSGRGTFTSQQGAQTLRITVAAFSTQQQNTQWGYNTSIKLNGTANVRSGYALMLEKYSPRSVAQQLVCDFYGCFYLETIGHNQNCGQWNNYCQGQSQNQNCGAWNNYCQGQNGGNYGFCNIPTNTDYTFVNAVGTGTGYNGQVTIQNARVTLTGGATIVGTLSGNISGGAVQGQTGTLSGSLRVETVNGAVCNQTISLQGGF